MKTRLTILMMMFVGISYGQFFNYFSGDQKWLQSSSCEEGTDCLLNTTFMYYIDGDSDVVATGELYHCIRKKGVSEYISTDSSISGGLCEGSYYFDHLSALLRQEGRKIYMFDMNEEVETLLYDFSLNEGDTLPVTPIQPLADITVESVDSFNLGVHYLRRLYLSTPDPYYIVEGIGSEFGFLEDMVPDIDCEYEHGCYYALETTQWENDDSEIDCEYTLELSVKEEVIQTLLVYPNPANEVLRLSADITQESIVEIYDISGVKYNLEMNSDNSLDISELSRGNYIVRLTNSDAVRTARFTKL